MVSHVWAQVPVCIHLWYTHHILKQRQRDKTQLLATFQLPGPVRVCFSKLEKGLLYVNGNWWRVKSEDLSVKIRRRLTRAVFRSPWEKECVCECVCVTVFWAGGNVRDVLGGVYVGVRGGGRRHYRWFSTPSALLKTYTPLVFKVSTQSCPCVSWNCPGSEIRRGERVWWLTGDTVAVSGGLKIA